MIHSVDHVGEPDGQRVGRDTDFAAETSQLTRNQILVSADTSVLAPANATRGAGRSQIHTIFFVLKDMGTSRRLVR